MRLLVINPNTSTSITERVAASVRPLLPPGTEAVFATGRFGGRYVADRATYAIAAHAALDAYAEHALGTDAVLIACFGDPGLAALKELAPVPVIGLAEASCREAARSGRFAIVTGGERWKPMLEEFVTIQGLSSHLAGIRTVAPTGAEIARDPDAAIAMLAESCRAAALEDGAEAVVLGGAGLAGLAERVQPHVPVPVLCSVASGLRAILGAQARPHPAGQPPPVATVGLAPALEAMLSKTH